MGAALVGACDYPVQYHCVFQHDSTSPQVIDTIPFVMFSILSVWIALGCFITALLTVFRPDAGADSVVTLLMYTIAASATLAAGVLWGLRKRSASDAGVAGQRIQALVALLINSVTFALILFALLDWRNALMALAIEYAFLWICWYGYSRVVLVEPPGGEKGE